MRIAIMQPYYFPYQAYFDLIKSVDIFVFLTDVQYIRRGWINRNRIRWNETWKYLTVPVVRCSRSTLIKDVAISGKQWKDDHLNSLIYSYGEMASNHQIFKHLESQDKTNLCDLLKETIQHTARFLGINTKFIDSVDIESNSRKQYRLIDTCKELGATTYVNATGGINLYNRNDFEKENIKLEFMPPTQGNKLSILDVFWGEVV